MPIRITGMNSGLDTESIITELVKAKSVKKDNLVKAQTKLEWKQDAWKDLNAKVYALYSKTLSNMRLTSDYTKKTTKVSNSNIASVITGATAVNGVQTLEVDELAETGYLTGAELQKGGKKADYKSTDTLVSLGGEGENAFPIDSELELKVGGETTKIKITKEMTIGDFVSTLKKAGLNASFDEKNQRFFISAKESGVKADFSLTAKAGDLNGVKAMQLMGIAANEDYLKYCKENAGSSETTKWVIDDTKIQALVKDEFEDRKNAFESAIRSIKGIEESINSYVTTYGESFKTENLADIEKELASKKEKLKKTVKFEEGEKEELEKEIAALEKKVEDKKAFDELVHQETNFKAIITANSEYFDVVKDDKGNVTSVSLKSEGGAQGLETALLKEVKEKAAFALEVLNGNYISSGATRIVGKDSKILLNGAKFTSNGNTFEINGLTITAHAKTDAPITLTTADDTDSIYDMIKGFLKEYNELINEMDKLYNADSAKGYEPLTEEEKEAMSEKEVEKWEEKIKNSILRKDSTLNSVASAMKQVMALGVKMADGSQLYLSDFGIGTLGYFTSKDNEKNAYHIDGDPDDASTMTNADKLKTMIANDPDKVVEFFSSLTKNLYEKIGDLMKKTEYSSSFTLYDDVAMKDEYNDYKSKISKQEQKITDYEDRYYKKFSAMETALAKLQSKESAVSGLFNI